MLDHRAATWPMHRSTWTGSLHLTHDFHTNFTHYPLFWPAMLHVHLSRLVLSLKDIQLDRKDTN